MNISWNTTEYCIVALCFLQISPLFVPLLKYTLFENHMVVGKGGGGGPIYQLLMALLFF